MHSYRVLLSVLFKSRVTRRSLSVNAKWLCKCVCVALGRGWIMSPLNSISKLPGTYWEQAQTLIIFFYCSICWRLTNPSTAFPHPSDPGKCFCLSSRPFIPKRRSQEDISSSEALIHGFALSHHLPYLVIPSPRAPPPVPPWWEEVAQQLGGAAMLPKHPVQRIQVVTYPLRWGQEHLFYLPSLRFCSQ